MLILVNDSLHRLLISPSSTLILFRRDPTESRLRACILLLTVLSLLCRTDNGACSLRDILVTNLWCTPLPCLRAQVNRPKLWVSRLILLPDEIVIWPSHLLAVSPRAVVVMCPIGLSRAWVTY